MKLFKQALFYSLVLAVLLAGVFCYKSFQQMDPDCSSGNHSLCSDFISHGTIIDGAFLESIFLIVLFVISYFVFKNFKRNILFYFNRIVIHQYQNRHLNKKITIPIMLAFYRGILHPRIP